MRLPFRKDASRSHRFDAGPPAASFGVDIPPELWAVMSSDAIAQRISRREALQVTAVLRARNLICTLATLPLRHIDAKNVPTSWPLFEQPDPDVATPVVWANTYEDLLFEGISWWRVTAFGWHNYPIAARHIPIGSVSASGSTFPAGGTQISPDQATFPLGGQVYVDGQPVPDNQLIRFDSLNPPLLTHAARAIRTCLLLDMHSATASKDPMPLGYFTQEEGAEPLEDDEIEGMLDDWEAKRARRAWGYMAGLKPNTLEWDPKKLQLAEQRNHAVLEIARATGLDPEDLGVSTTTRTYQNSEQRRQDLIDFTLAPYIAATQARLSMGDVTMRGYRARIDFADFLRGDTKTRMETYDVGLRVGAYTKPEIRELEDKPPLPASELEPPAPATPPTADAGDMPEGAPMQTNARLRPAASMEADEHPRTEIYFDDPAIAESFRVDTERRIITGLAVPWNKVAVSGFSKWRFAPDSLRWSEASRVKLNRDHDRHELIGRATRLQSGSSGLTATFKVAKTADGDTALNLADDQILDGFSIEIDFLEEFGDDWQPDPTDESVRLVRQATLTGVALTPNPAFDDARVTRVAASRDPQGVPDGQDHSQGSPARRTIRVRSRRIRRPD